MDLAELGWGGPEIPAGFGAFGKIRESTAQNPIATYIKYKYISIKYRIQADLGHCSFIFQITLIIKT